MASLCLVPSGYLSSSVEPSEMLLLMLDRIFWPWLCLAEEAFILGSPPWNITPKSLPLFISVDLYPMSILPRTYEVSLDWALGPIHSTGPNIPTVTIIKTTLFWFYLKHNINPTHLSAPPYSPFPLILFVFFFSSSLLSRPIPAPPLHSSLTYFFSHHLRILDEKPLEIRRRRSSTSPFAWI